MIEDFLTLAWYEYPGNFSNGQSVNGMSSFMSYIDHLLTGGLGYAIIGFLILFMIFGFSKLKFEKYVGVVMFICLVVSVLLMRVGMVPLWICIVFGFLTALSVLWSSDKNKKSYGL